MTVSISQFFGENGAFGEACDLYRKRGQLVPASALEKARNLGDPKDIGFVMGYLFASVLHTRKLPITAEELRQIGVNKFPQGGPEPFIQGFAEWEQGNV